MKPFPDEQYDRKPRHNSDSRSTLRAGVHRIYLPAPLDAQAWAEMQPGLSPRLQSDPVGTLHGYAMEVPASTPGRRRDRRDPLHDNLQSVRQMVRRWLARSGIHRQREASGGATPPRSQRPSWRWLQHRREERWRWHRLLRPQTSEGRESPRDRGGVAGRTPTRFAAARRASRRTALPPFAHDGTERRIVRPQDAAEQTECYSGKKKDHTVKNVLGLTRAAGVVCPSDRALRTTSVPVWRRGSHWIGRRSRPIISEVRAKKLSGGSAVREVPDTAAPTRSTSSRGLFATLGETSRYFNHPKTNKTPEPLAEFSTL